MTAGKSEKLGVLHPVRVPWMISPSVPHLRYDAGGKNSGSATFIAFFGAENGTSSEDGPSSEGLLVIGDPGSFIPSMTALGSRHRLLRVSFERVLHARTLPACSDLEVVAEDAYDWSFVSGRFVDRTPDHDGSEDAWFEQEEDGSEQDDGVEQHLIWFDQEWRSTGWCPDPAIYEVRNSSWLAELELPEATWRHFLLLGQDDYLEVVARGFRWTPGQPTA